MAKTLTQVAAQIARELGEDYNDLDLKVLFDEWIVEALHAFIDFDDWPFLRQEGTFNTVASTATYNLALGTGEITSVRRTSPTAVQALEHTTKDKLVNEGYDLDVEGESSHWYFDGMSSDQQVIGLWPVPSAIINYTVRSDLEPSQLTPASTWPMPEDTIPVVKNFVRKLWRESIGDYPGADRAYAAWQESLKKVFRKYQSPAAISRTFAWSDVDRSDTINYLRFPDTIT